MQIEKSLVQNKCLTLPHIYIRPEVDKCLIPKLKDIIKRHQGSICDNIDNATHIVHPLSAHPGLDGKMWFSFYLKGFSESLSLFICTKQLLLSTTSRKWNCTHFIIVPNFLSFYFSVCVCVCNFSQFILSSSSVVQSIRGGSGEGVNKLKSYSKSFKKHKGRISSC